MLEFISSSVKICRWDGGVCGLGSCSWLESSGKVVLCRRHRNPRGREK
jgi:hypothetical protein